MKDCISKLWNLEGAKNRLNRLSGYTLWTKKMRRII